MIPETETVCMAFQGSTSTPQKRYHLVEVPVPDDIIYTNESVYTKNARRGHFKKFSFNTDKCVTYGKDNHPEGEVCQAQRPNALTAVRNIKAMALTMYRLKKPKSEAFC